MCYGWRCVMGARVVLLDAYGIGTMLLHHSGAMDCADLGCSVGAMYVVAMGHCGAGCGG